MGYYYRYAVINVSIGDYFPIEIIDVINEFKPAGVTMYVTYDGATTIRGGTIIKWLDGLPKIETYQEYERFIGYDDTFYGHINMNESKDSDNSSSDIFKTNHSVINSSDVLAGSSSIGRQYVNYGYITSYTYNPDMSSSVNQINASTNGRGQEVPYDYYMYTGVRNNNTIELEMQTSSGVSYLYNNFNFRDYMNKYRPQVDIQSDEARRNVSDYIKELSIDYYLSAVIPPDESIEVKLQVYDFSINRWLTVSISNLSFYEQNIGSNIGYVKDYLNNELNMFTRLEINAGRRDSVDIKVNYLDLMFYYYERNVYTIKQYRAIVENYLDITREAYVEAFKIASLDNGDIISKTGYQPVGYLRLTDGYDNNINRNLLMNSKSLNKDWDSTKGTYTYYWAFYINEVHEQVSIGDYITVSFDVQMERGDILRVYDSNHNHDFSFGEQTFTNIGTKKQRLSFTKELVAPSKSTENWQIAFYNDNNNDKFMLENIKIEKGQEATPYQPNPEDLYGANDPNSRIVLQAEDKDGKIIPSTVEGGSTENNVSFIDKKITFKNINTEVQNISITNDFTIPYVKLQYSYYGNDWVTLKELTDVTQGETIITNNLIDVFGLQTVDYSNINPMSNVSLRSIWNVKLGELNNKEGSLSNMSNNYFNAVWQDIDKLTDINFGSMKIVKDTEGGVFDGSTGEIIQATLLNTDTYTDLDKLSYTLNKYIEPLTLGSSRLISELKDELLTTESLNIDNRIKVVDTDTEITINE